MLEVKFKKITKNKLNLIFLRLQIWEEWRHARETSGQREHGFPDAGEIKVGTYTF